MDLHKALKKIEGFSEWVGLREVQSKTHEAWIRNGHTERTSCTAQKGVMVEVLVEGQFSYAATNDLREESIISAAQKAIQSANSTYKIHDFTVQNRPQVTGTYQSLSKNKKFSTSDAGMLNKMFMEITKKANSKNKIVSSRLGYSISEVESFFISSNGTDIHQKFHFVRPFTSATAQEGNESHTRSPYGRGFACFFQGDWDTYFTEEIFQERMEKSCKQAVELLDAEECPTGSMSLVLSPDQMLLQIHESVGHPLELDRILGDERNYAGLSFVKKEDFGNLQYGSKLMNIVFDPTVDGQSASYSFDDLGTPAKKQYLIKKGVLLRGLGGIDSQSRSQISGVACARATNWNRPPIDRMANVNLEPGETPFEDIISGIERGVYMEANRSWSIDDYRHKFQFGCEYARLIENGKITKTIKNPNYRGETKRFWNSLIQIGDEKTAKAHASPFCGKGEPNQAIWVGHASPHCHFKNIEVFGGAK